MSSAGADHRAAWMGHSKRIAETHYLQVTDAQFQKALGPAPPAVSPSSGAATAVPQKNGRK